MPAATEFIHDTVNAGVTRFAQEFAAKYRAGGTGQRNIINKANNPFIRALGPEIVVYSALMRSLDSSLGNALEKIARTLAAASYTVSTRVEGDVPLSAESSIAALMNSYQSRQRMPRASDIEAIFPATQDTGPTIHKVHASDYHLVRRDDPRHHYLLELKIGGDLDNKKARSEKEALLEQYAILKHSPAVASESIIRLYFATAYNKNGEEDWDQERVKQFFGDDELLIGIDFWNFICDRADGGEIVLEAYSNAAPVLRAALAEIVEATRDPDYSSLERARGRHRQRRLPDE